jgi:hypothetical protein
MTVVSLAQTSGEVVAPLLIIHFWVILAPVLRHRFMQKPARHTVFPPIESATPIKGPRLLRPNKITRVCCVRDDAVDTLGCENVGGRGIVVLLVQNPWDITPVVYI